MASLLLPIAEIPEEGLEFTRPVTRGELLLEETDPPTCDEFTLSACVNVAGTDVLVQGNLVGTFRLECVRCLNQFHQPFRLSFDGVFSPDGDGHSPGDTNKPRFPDGPADEIEVYVIQNESVALGELLREQVILSLPMHPLCAQDCEGLCSQCGENLNEKRCACSPAAIASPFSVLQNLVKLPPKSRIS